MKGIVLCPQHVLGIRYYSSVTAPSFHRFWQASFLFSWGDFVQLASGHGTAIVKCEGPPGQRGNESQTESSVQEKGVVNWQAWGIVLYGTVYRTERGESGQPMWQKTDWIGYLCLKNKAMWKGLFTSSHKKNAGKKQSSSWGETAGNQPTHFILLCCEVIAKLIHHTNQLPACCVFTAASICRKGPALPLLPLWTRGMQFQVLATPSSSRHCAFYDTWAEENQLFFRPFQTPKSKTAILQQNRFWLSFLAGICRNETCHFR